MVALVLAAAACGDDLPRETVVGAHSGNRLMLQKYRFTDGTEQAVGDEFFDRALHTRCTPREWDDGGFRCVPVADDAVYADPTCEQLMGRAFMEADPTHFLLRELIADEETPPPRVVRAGGRRAATSQYYLRYGDACAGPYVDPPDTSRFYDVRDEVPAGDLVTLTEREVGDGRLALRLRESADGLQVPVGMRDRELDLPCTVVNDADGGARCEPGPVAAADHYRDPSCREPVIVTIVLSTTPSLARVVEPDGCAGFRPVGELIVTALYRRDGVQCVPVPVTPELRVFALGPPLEVAALTREIEDVPGRRLQQMVLADGDLRFHSDVLYDTAIRADCRRLTLAADVIRCLPADLSSSTLLYRATTCAAGAPMAEMAGASCRRPGFAIAGGETGLEVRAIGDPAPGPLYEWSFGQCVPYAAAPGVTVHALGPPIDLEAFAGAIYFGER